MFSTKKSLLSLIGRDESLFVEDLKSQGERITLEVANSNFLVVGGAGSIGGAVVKELFRRRPQTLHVIDTSENNLAELVRDIRSSLGYIDGDFHAYCFDALGREFDALTTDMARRGINYDYVLNFSALKHVRSEKDPFTLMRLIDVNVFLTKRLLEFSNRIQAKKFFCVSTDKAANPVNMMGGSKRIMEMFLTAPGNVTKVSTARFANVAFSDGSLPHAWTQRIRKKQPIAAPNDVKRYFVTEQEGAVLCLFSILLGDDTEIFFPKLSERLHLITFASMAEKYLTDLGWQPYPCSSEEEARSRIDELTQKGLWPCYFFGSDTTGEKDFEEFYTDSETVDWGRFREIGVVKNSASAETSLLGEFEERIHALRSQGTWSKSDLLETFTHLLPNFRHLETGKYLDGKM